MTKAYIIEIVLGVLAVLATLVGYYFYVKAKISRAATDAVNSAEELDKIGAEKLEAAVEQVYALVPAILKPIFSKALIGQLIQEAFDKIEAYAKKQLAKKGNKTDAGK